MPRRRHPASVFAAVLLLSTFAAAVLTGCWYALDFAAGVAANQIIDRATDTPSHHQ